MQADDAQEVPDTLVKHASAAADTEANAADNTVAAAQSAASTTKAATSTVDKKTVDKKAVAKTAEQPDGSDTQTFVGHGNSPVEALSAAMSAVMAGAATGSGADKQKQAGKQQLPAAAAAGKGSSSSAEVGGRCKEAVYMLAHLLTSYGMPGTEREHQQMVAQLLAFPRSPTCS